MTQKPQQTSYFKHSYSLEDDVSSDEVKRLLEAISCELKKPKERKIDLYSSNDAARLLEEFVRVKDVYGLFKYVKKFGLPDKRPERIYLEQKNDLPKPGLPVTRKIKQEYFYRLAATLRWLTNVLVAIRLSNHEQLETWITTRPRFGQFTQSADSELEKSAKQQKDIVDLTMEPPFDTDIFNDWWLTGEYFNHFIRVPPYLQLPSDRLCLQPFRVSKEKWSDASWKRKESIDFAKAYLAFHINRLMEAVHPAVSNEGVPHIAVEQPFEAMCVYLYNQFSGASGVGVCLNPNCPERIYIVKRKGKKGRAPRSDRRYCDSPACQNWGYRNLGNVRSAKKDA